MKRFNLLYLFVWIITVLFSSTAFSISLHWQTLQGPRVNGRFNIVVMKNNNNLLFAYSRNSPNTDIYKSIDGGRHWQVIITPEVHAIHHVISLDQNSLLLAGDNNLFISQDKGSNWWITKRFDESCDQLFSPTSRLILLITNNNTSTPKLYRSTDGGKTFIRSYLGINGGIPFSAMGGIENLLILGTDRILISTDQGLLWRQTSSNWKSKLLSSAAVNQENDIYVAANNRLYQTDSTGQIWKEIMSAADGVANVQINANGFLYVVSGAGLYRSKNEGKTWELLRRFNQIIEIHLLDGGKILVNTDEGLLESDESQFNYFKLAEFPFVASTNTHVLAVDSTHFFATVLPYLGPIYGSNDTGRTWHIKRSTAVIDMKSFNRQIVVLEYDGEQQQLIVSNDRGATWHSTLKIDNNYCYNISAQHGALIINCQKDNYFSQDLTHWLTLKIKKKNPIVMSYFSGKAIYVTDGQSVQRSTDKALTWKYLLNNLNQHRAYLAGYNDDLLIIAVEHIGVLKMSQDGNAWHLINNGLSNFNFTNLIVIDATHYLISTNEGVFYTENGGTEWLCANSGLKNRFVLDMSLYRHTLLAGTEGSGVFRSDFF